MEHLNEDLNENLMEYLDENFDRTFNKASARLFDRKLNRAEIDRTFDGAFNIRSGLHLLHLFAQEQHVPFCPKLTKNSLHAAHLYGG